MAGPLVLIGAAGLLLGLFVAGVPVFLAFLALNTAGVALFMGPQAFGMVANSIFTTATTGTLTAIALFVLMGEILFRSGAAEVLFDAVDRLVGRMRGRQFVLAGVLSTVFGALSGSNMAVAALMARTIFPGMERRGYDRNLSIGMILGGASLAPVIPPSVLVIIIATLAKVSVAGLLVAGVLPGLLLGAAFVGYALLRVRLNPDLAPPPETPAKGTAAPVGRALLHCVPFAGLIVLVVGLILFGIATPSESAAAGVLGALAIAAMFRRASLEMLVGALRSAVLLTAMILIIMASSTLFSQLLAISGASAQITRFVSDLGWPPVAMLLAMMALVFVFCLFIDQVAVMLVIIPIYAPLVALLGFDPMWFWLLMLLNVTVGGITPPFGYAMFAFRGAAPQVPMAALFAAAWPFVGLFLLVMLIVGLVPGLATWLPSLL
ncbi:TRAP transporter large permease [Rhodobaculum claviforme]|uniref:C4-dicarboxylate ABC transporter permease n=1 Tax=Rhodobaculum claviforme TaxID=1549854 RepID=A0A934TMK0_9RHOB|nr:TRAP transporter large permease [Rhodobaculum claviforme]MBK5928388.1 C4-dicarboxylate ABC transporter permease [Rhodobaculum claviforme]